MDRLVFVVGSLLGKSESKRLFGTDHSMMSKLPEEIKNLACLKMGANEIRVDYQGCRLSIRPPLQLSSVLNSNLELMNVYSISVKSRTKIMNREV
jgi:hypothetical protein